MALALTPRLLRRGLELFAIISLAGVIVVLAVYGENVQAVGSALLHLHWGWLVVGLGLASMDWIGGGLRLWVVARHVHPGVRLKDMIIAGGMSAWAAYLTPFQSGAGPTMMWVMRRAGVRLPEAMTSTFMTFVATVVFFAIAGPLAIYLGAGKSLEQHNVILGITYYGLFRTSLTIFGILGIVMLIAMVFPAWLRDAVHWLAGRLERKSHRIAARIEQLRDGEHRLAALLVLAAEGVGRAGGSGEHRVKRVSLRGYAVGRNFRRCLFRLKGLSQMALLELGGKRFTIPVGEMTLGSDASCAISLSGADVLPRHALLQGQADGQVIIRKVSPAADVLINGVRLGAEPTPLLHGDKVEVGGHELTFVDERRSGSTQFVKAFTPATAAGPPKAGAKPPAIGVTGGRVVSLTDGREYVIAAASLVFGREAGCDVVVAGKDVSRRHAEIVQTPKGYLLVDSSTNGTFVNEERVEGQRILARADVIRLGDEQFRFYADVAPATASPPTPPGPAASPPQPVPPASPPGAPQAGPPPGATDRLRHTVHGLEAFVPASPRAAAGGALASFLVRSGGLVGQRLSVRSPVVNIGRADYNDLVVPDPSVSTSHAKLQRREGVWVLVDLDSTNGTFVDGEQVKGDAPLAPGATVRLGDVQLVFEPSDDALSIAKGGGTQMLRTPHSTAPNAPPRPASPPS